MKKIALYIALLFSGITFAQSEIVNNYKYVILPKKFEFFKEENKYNLNQITKLAFEKYGFTVLFSDEQMPADIALNRCRALYGDLENNSGMLTTKVSVLVKDCFGKVIFKSDEGSSKLKDFDKAYFQATREAAQTLSKLNYSYVGDAAAAQYFAGHGQAVAVPQTPAAPAAPAVVPQQVVNQNTLFAQPIANGYQLVDSTPKVVLKMYKTSQPDSYTAVGETKNGVVFKKGNEWFFEYYQNDKLVSEKLDIKF